MNTALMEYDQDTRSLGEYITIFKRRRLTMATIAAIVFMLAVLLALSWPPTYRSTATILIEEQEVPREMVQSTITSFAAQRVQVITQRIMTVDTIAEVVERFGLYQEEGNSKLPRTLMAQKFHNDMALDLVSAEVIDPRSGRPTEATIAFTLSFDNESPSTAQKVANELVTLYLNENLRNRAEKAESTAAFLGAEARSLNNELLELETKLSLFKKQHEGSLPELYQYNLSTVERTDRELSILNRRLQELEKRKIEITSELARVPKRAPVRLPTGEMILSDTDRLRALEAEYKSRVSLYHDSHPDMEALKHEIELLKAASGRSEAGGKAITDNPTYVLLENQLNALNAEREALLGQQQDLEVKKSRFESHILKAPEVEKEYLALLRDYNNATAKYQELKAKQREAELAENLELERKGERFVLVEPPLLPLGPVSPNRPAILVLGLIVAALAGMGAALAREFMDKAIYGEKQLTDILGTPPLVVIPYLYNNSDIAERHLKIKRAVITCAVIGLLFTLYIHFAVKPLDVIFFMLLNKLA